MSSALLALTFVLLGTSGAFAITLIDNRADALAYVDRTFAASDCRMRQSAFFRQMEIDGVAPTVDDMARPMDGSLKIIKQRRVLGVLKTLFDEGRVCEDASDKHYAISKFGGCA